MGQASQRFRIEEEEEEDGNILIVVGISPLQQFWPDPGAVHMHWPFISLRIVKGTMRVPYTLLFLVNSKHFIYRKNLSPFSNYMEIDRIFFTKEIPKLTRFHFP